MGAGEIRFSMENPNNGAFVKLHHIHWANRYTMLHSENPSYKLGMVTYNLGGGATTVKSGSAFGANEGVIKPSVWPSSTYISKSSLTSGAIHHLISLRNPVTNVGKINTREVKLKQLSLSFQGNDPLNVILYLDEPFATGTQLFTSLPGIISKISTATATINATPVHAPIAGFTLPINGSGTLNLEDLALLITPNSTLNIGVISSQTISQISASLIWLED